MSSTVEVTECPGKILVVDDNADNRLLLASQLKMRHYQVIQADDGLAGLEMAALEQPDLILLDVMMPGIDGFSVCARLKENPVTSTIPVVMVTALREVEYRIRGIEAGADEFLSRPHHREELLIRVRALIQLKRARHRLEEERNRLQLLYDVSRAITAQLDLEQMMVEIITHTQSAVGAAKGTLLLLDGSSNVTHKFSIRAGGRAETTRHARPEIIRHGLAGWLVRHNRAEIIADISKDKRWISLPGDEEPCGAVIGVPLSRKDEGIGVLLLTHPETNYFMREHLALLTTIGAQVTAAIENAYLFAEVDEQRRKLEAILAQSTDVIITTDPNWRIAIVNQAGERFFELSANNVIGQSLRHVPQLDILLPLFVKAGDRPVTQEVNLNNSKVLYASVSPIRGVGYVAVMQDITELKRIEGIRLTQERREKQTVKDTFSRYMGPRLVEHVLTTDPKLLGRRERRRAVVMFADLRNFTGMVVGVEPDQAILTLNEFFSVMTDVVHEFDGTIFDLAGDEMMVGFNVPFDQPNAPYRALLTAVTMQRRFNTLRQKWRHQLNTDLGLGVGIDQGEVVVGNVGADTRMNFAMVGEAVNTAHRLVELADDGQVIISEMIYRAIENEMPRLLEVITFESMGPIALKGKHQPQTLYRIQIERVPQVADQLFDS
jgi:PAS domain S-box-containing protein